MWCVYWVILLCFFHVIYAAPRLSLSLEQELLKSLTREGLAFQTIGRDTRTIICDSMTITQIGRLSLQSQSLTVQIHLELIWRDSRLEWQHMVQYREIKQLRMHANQVWIPDITLVNDADALGSFDQRYSSNFVMIYPDGSVRWVLYLNLQSVCVIDMARFPFDEQTCHLLFTPWSYGYERLTLKLATDVVVSKDYGLTSEWNVVNISVSPQNSSRVRASARDGGLMTTGFKVSLVLRRKAFYYIFHVFTPVIAICGLNLAGLMIPIEKRGDKIILGLSVVVAQTWYLMAIAPDLPACGDALPVLGNFISAAMVVTCGSLSVCVLVIHMHFNKHLNNPPPGWLVKCALFILWTRSCLITKSVPHEEDAEESIELVENENPELISRAQQTDHEEQEWSDYYDNYDGDGESLSDEGFYERKLEAQTICLDPTTDDADPVEEDLNVSELRTESERRLTFLFILYQLSQSPRRRESRGPDPTGQWDVVAAAVNFLLTMVCLIVLSVYIIYIFTLTQ